MMMVKTNWWDLVTNRMWKVKKGGDLEFLAKASRCSTMWSKLR